MSIVSNYSGYGAKSKEETEILTARSKRCVCKKCGGALTTSLMIYDIYGGAGVELYCPKCQQSEFGVEPEIYEMAQYYVENFQFNYFLDMEENDLNEQLNISKVADMISWLLKNLGLLDGDGLKDKLPDYQFYERLHL